MRANSIYFVCPSFICAMLAAEILCIGFDTALHGAIQANPTDASTTAQQQARPSVVGTKKETDNAIATYVPPSERTSWQPKELVAHLGTGRGRHWGDVYEAARSRDGKWIASVGADRVIRVWDARLQEQAVLPFWCFSVAFSPDSKTLAASTGYEILLWDMSGMEPKSRARFRTNGSGVESLAFSPDSTMLASGDRRGVVRLWNCKHITPTEASVVQGEVDLIHTVAFSPTGEVLAASGLKGIHLWSLTGEELKPRAVLRDHQKPVWSISFTADGKWLASGSYDGTAKLWDLTKQPPAVRTTLPTEQGQAFSVAFAPDAKTLAVGCGQGGMMQIWNVQADTPKKKFEFRGHKTHVWSLMFSNDGKTLTSGSRDGTIRLWDVTGTMPKELIAAGQPAFTYSIAFSPDGGELASGHIGAIRVWNLRGKRPEHGQLLKGDINAVMCLDFSSRKKRLAAAYTHKRVELWDVSNEISRSVTIINSYAGSANPVTFTPDGGTVACVVVGSKPRKPDFGGINDVRAPSDHIVQFIDVDGEKPRVRVSLKGHDREIKSLAFAPSGKIIAVSSGTIVKLWDLSGKEPIEYSTLKGHERDVMSIAFAPSGETLLSAGMDKTVLVWNIKGEHVTKRASLDIHTQYVKSVAFAPNGKLFASAGADGRVVLWDEATCEKRHEWQLPGLVYQVAFSPDSQHLATANRNGTVYILQLPH